MYTLSKTLVELCDKRGTVPVIVVPRELRLRPEFFASLVDGVRRQIDLDPAGERANSPGGVSHAGGLCDPRLGRQEASPANRTRRRRIRVEWLMSGDGWAARFSRIETRLRIARINREFLRTGCEAEATQTYLLSRPAGRRRAFVFGVASAATPLPGWGTAIEIGTTPVVHLPHASLSQAG